MGWSKHPEERFREPQTNNTGEVSVGSERESRGREREQSLFSFSLSHSETGNWPPSWFKECVALRDKHFKVSSLGQKSN